MMEQKWRMKQLMKMRKENDCTEICFQIMKRGSFEIGEKDDIHGNNCKITIKSNILMIIQ